MKILKLTAFLLVLASPSLIVAAQPSVLGQQVMTTASGAATNASLVTPKITNGTNTGNFVADFVLFKNVTPGRVAIYDGNGIGTNGPITAAQLTNLGGTSEPITNSLAVLSNLITQVQTLLTTLSNNDLVVSNLLAAVSNQTFAAKGMLVGTNGPNIYSLTNGNPGQFVMFQTNSPWITNSQFLYWDKTNNWLTDWNVPFVIQRTFFQTVDSDGYGLYVASSFDGSMTLGNGNAGNQVKKTTLGGIIDHSSQPNDEGHGLKVNPSFSSTSTTRGDINIYSSPASYGTLQQTHFFHFFGDAIPAGTEGVAATFASSNVFGLNRYNFYGPTTASNLLGGDIILDLNAGFGFAPLQGPTNGAQVARFYWTNNAVNLGDGLRTGGRHNLAVSNVTAVAVMGTTNNPPTIAAGTGAGSSPTISVTGSDLAGVIAITPGLTPAASAVVATVTFGTVKSGTCAVVMWPHNAAAAALSFLPYTVGSTTNFTINSGAGAAVLVASTAYEYNYHVIQTGQ